MGYVLRSNIFDRKSQSDQGNEPRERFLDFPIQATVLYSPAQKDFAEAFKDLFFNLHKLTGEYVVFFAVLDPPQEWIEDIRLSDNYEWWKDFQPDTDLSYDDRILTMELARRFGLEWEQLPALIVSNDLWQSEYITTSTSANEIESQFRALTQLVKSEYQTQRPPIERIREALDDIRKVSTLQTYPAASNLFHFYNAAELYKVQPRRFDTIAQQAYRSAIGNLSRFRRRDPINVWTLREEFAWSSALSTSMGMMIVPAYVSREKSRITSQEFQFPDIEHLEEDSQIMIKTAFYISKFQKSRHFDDFTPSAQGVWKAIELEANYSVIQAARKARGIDVSKYYGLYQSDFKGDSRVRASFPDGRNSTTDINRVDRDIPKYHKKLMFMEAQTVVQHMSNNMNENFDNIMQTCFGDTIPKQWFDDWSTIHHMRNPSSHTVPLSEYDLQALTSIINRGFFDIFVKTKLHLKPN